MLFFVQDWMSDMKNKDDSLKANTSLAADGEDLSLPPIRGEGITITGDGVYVILTRILHLVMHTIYCY